MSGRDADGFRRGTNYCHRLASRSNPAAQIAEHLVQRSACERGEHAEVTAKTGYKTRVGGRTLEPGTVYCACCKRVKDEPGWEPILADNGAAITVREASVIDALRELGEHWPDSLTLLSMDGQLCVIHTADHDVAAGAIPGADRTSVILAVIDGIPNDGGAW
jgi:hypothetical protein